MPGVGILLDEAQPLLDQVGDVATARGLALVGARAVGSLVREHLFGLDGQRHRAGGSHFFAQAARSVTAGAVPQGATVSITQQGFRQRLFGGKILPSKKYLTIPASPEAYGKRAGEFRDLEFKVVVDPQSGSLRPALVLRSQTRVSLRSRRGKDGKVSTSIKNLGEIGGEVMFWLVRSVNQAADASVLPYGEQMSAVALRAMRTRFDRLQQGNQPNAGGDN